MRAEVDKELVHEKNKLVNLMDNTTKSQLTTQFNQEDKISQRKKAALDARFQSPQKPDFAKAIMQYLRSPETTQLYEDVLRWSEDEKMIPTETQINYLTGKLGKRLHIQDTVRRPLKEAFLASKIVILDYFSRELPF